MLLNGFPSTAELISRIIVVLIAMDVHEFAHAWVANRMGDSTARDMGKMSLDPRANINWMGFAMFVFIGFGILGQVPVNDSRMRDRRLGPLLTAAAGPFSNLALAAICAIPFWLGLAHIDYAAPKQLFPTLNIFFTDMVLWNVLLFVFNLIPLFPLDGWKVVSNLLPRDLSYTWVRWQQYSTYVLFALIFVPIIFPGINPFSEILGPPIAFLQRLFYHIL